MSSEKEDDSLTGGRTESGWRKIVGAVADVLDGLEFLALLVRLVWGAVRALPGLLRHLID